MLACSIGARLEICDVHPNEAHLLQAYSNTLREHIGLRQQALVQVSRQVMLSNLLVKNMGRWEDRDTIVCGT